MDRPRARGKPWIRSWGLWTGEVQTERITTNGKLEDLFLSEDGRLGVIVTRKETASGKGNSTTTYFITVVDARTNKVLRTIEIPSSDDKTYKCLSLGGSGGLHDWRLAICETTDANRSSFLEDRQEPCSLHLWNLISGRQTSEIDKNAFHGIRADFFPSNENRWPKALFSRNGQRMLVLSGIEHRVKNPNRFIDLLNIGVPSKPAPVAELTVWEVPSGRSGKELQRIIGNGEEFVTTPVAIAPDGHFVVTGIVGSSRLASGRRRPGNRRYVSRVVANASGVSPSLQMGRESWQETIGVPSGTGTASAARSYGRPRLKRGRPTSDVRKQGLVKWSVEFQRAGRE